MYPKLILRNVFRNLQTYTIYFFSLTLIYSLLYAFNALPSHPVMQSLSGAKEMLTTVMSQYMGLLSYLILSAIAFLVVYPGTAQERAGTLCNAGNEEEADYPYLVL